MKKYFKDTSNFISFCLALVPAFLFYNFKASDSVPYVLFVALLLLLLLFSWLSLKLYLDLRDMEQEERQPSIKLASCHEGYCLCHPNGLITYNSVVSFYQTSDGLEKLIGYGYVQTITENKLAQIIPQDPPNEEIGTLYNKINDQKTCIVIRPTVTKDTLEQLQNLF